MKNTFSVRGIRVALGGVLVLVASACASAGGPFVWADDFVRNQPPTTEYRVNSGDLLSIQVWDNAQMSARARVRGDGRISLPLIDELDVAGKTPVQVARELERELSKRSLVIEPKVSVSLEETKALTVTVLGEVVRSGMYTLGPEAGVAEALASAGGLTDFAHKDQIFVIRRNPEPVRIRFTFSALAEARGGATTFRLQPGDVVVAR